MKRREFGKRLEDDTVIALYSTDDGSHGLVAEVTDSTVHLLKEGGQESALDFFWHGIILAGYEPSTRILTTYPRWLAAHSPDFGARKYVSVSRISLEEALPIYVEGNDGESSYNLRQFPPGFVDNPFEGFGLVYMLRFIVEAIEELDGVEEIRLCSGDDTSFDGGIFRLPKTLYESMRKTLNRTHRAAVNFANVEKRSFLRLNLVSQHQPEEKRSPVMLRTKRELVSVLEDAINAPGRRSKIRSDNQSAALRVVRSSAREMVVENRTELLELSREIEVVTLQVVIERFEARIADPDLGEGSWQRFLSSNPFILKLAFGLPAIVFREQMPVGGWNLDNKGGKLADFVVKSGAIGNLSIVEIKTPDAKLLSAKEYRGGIHGPSAGLSGAVTQVMDQRYHLLQNITTLLRNSRDEDAQTYDVGCIVVAGTTPTSDVGRKSFELFRGNLRGVVVITFDELLEKLKALHRFLVEPPKPEGDGDFPNEVVEHDLGDDEDEIEGLDDDVEDDRPR